MDNVPDNAEGGISYAGLFILGFGALFMLVGIDSFAKGLQFIEPLCFGGLFVVIGVFHIRYNITYEDRASGKLAILFPCIGPLFIIAGVDLLLRGLSIGEYIPVLTFGVVITIIGVLLLRRTWFASCSYTDSKEMTDEEEARPTKLQIY